MKPTVAATPDGGLKTWFQRIGRQNLWRMPSDIGVEDLVQEGNVCWLVCRQKHPEFNTPQTVGYVKLSFYNRLNDYSTRRTRLYQIPLCDLVGESFSSDTPAETRLLERHMTPVDELGTIAVLIAQAPAEIKALFNLFLTDAGFKQQRRRHRTFDDGRLETDNELVARLAGIDPTRSGWLDVLREYIVGVGATA